MFWENAFTILMLPTGATLLLFLYYQIYKKEKKPFQMYFNYYFALMLIKLFFFTIRAHAHEYVSNNYTENNTYIESECFYYQKNLNNFFDIQKEEELFFLKDIECLTNTQVKEYQKKYEHELKEGHRCFNQANNLCLLLPNSSDQEKANKLFEIAIATAAGYAISGYGGVITALVVELSAYLSHSVKEYQKMKSLLLESKMHYELAAFYQDILKKY